MIDWPTMRCRQATGLPSRVEAGRRACGQYIGPVVAAPDVVLAGPDQLHRRARPSAFAIVHASTTIVGRRHWRAGRSRRRPAGCGSSPARASSPAAAAALPWSMVWNCVPAQISQRSACQPDDAVQRLHRRMREIRELVARLELLRGACQRLLRHRRPCARTRPACSASAAYSAMMCADAARLGAVRPIRPSARRGPSSPPRSLRRPRRRRAGSGRRRPRPAPPCAGAASNDLTFAPKTRRARDDARSACPGSLTSRPNCAVPLVFAGVSSARHALADQREVLGILRAATSAGTGSRGAPAASSPKVALAVAAA